MTDDLTIVYYTDNSLPEQLEHRCQRELIRAAQGKIIISVSQKPMDFGMNICLGDLGRSHHSLFTQALTGVKAAPTKYIALAEHDCMYTPEHFDWRPSDDGVFWYNVNHYFVSLRTGEYSYYRRRPMSQLICTREQFIPCVEEKLFMLEQGFEVRKGQPGACEPGVCEVRQAFSTAYDEFWAKYKDVGKEPPWRAGAFRTKLPNLDIRGSHNFSGNRRGKDPVWTLPYWGRFCDVLSDDFVPDR